MSVKIKELHPECDIFISAAAVADFAPVEKVNGKIKKNENDSLSLLLARTTDILSDLGSKKGRKIHIGFALETNDPEKNAKRKMVSKNLDAIILNNPNEDGAAFEHTTNKVTIFTADNKNFDIPLATKTDVAAKIFDNLHYLWSK